MTTLLEYLSTPWSWYVAGPIIGLMVPVLLLIGNRSFGISSNLRHLCAISQPKNVRVAFFQYDWREYNWCLMFGAGVVIGGYLATDVFSNPEPLKLSAAAIAMFQSWGVSLSDPFLPPEMFDPTPMNLFILAVSGVIIGFGTRYASGCTSGHAITGLATLQPESLIAVVGIFGGGLLASHFLVQWLL
jgi:uncharacterized membrane protein YedE/YeeE